MRLKTKARNIENKTAKHRLLRRRVFLNVLSASLSFFHSPDPERV